jgi:hypothetical protein
VTRHDATRRRGGIDDVDDVPDRDGAAGAIAPIASGPAAASRRWQRPQPGAAKPPATGEIYSCTLCNDGRPDSGRFRRYRDRVAVSVL